MKRLFAVARSPASDFCWPRCSTLNRSSWRIPKGSVTYRGDSGIQELPARRARAGKQFAQCDGLRRRRIRRGGLGSHGGDYRRSRTARSNAYLHGRHAGRTQPSQDGRDHLDGRAGSRLAQSAAAGRSSPLFQHREWGMWPVTSLTRSSFHPGTREVAGAKGHRRRSAQVWRDLPRERAVHYVREMDRDYGQLSSSSG